MRAPLSNEYDAFYATYVSKVADGEVLSVLRSAPAALSELLAGLTPEEERFAYDDGKWSVREVLGHVVDTERLFTYRALHIARGDSAALPGMDHHVWAAASNAAERPVADLLEEFRSLRAANCAFFESLDDESLVRRGIASGCEVTVRALVHIVAGHQLHHHGILAERYLPAMRGVEP